MNNIVDGAALIRCRFCGLPIEKIGGYMVVMGTGTSADGLSFCPPNPDHDGELGSHEPPCDHEWVAGMMIVHPDDLEETARARAAFGGKIECTQCDEVYKVN
jgi:ribosomal protein L24E